MTGVTCTMVNNPNNEPPRTPVQRYIKQTVQDIIAQVQMGESLRELNSPL